MTTLLIFLHTIPPRQLKKMIKKGTLGNTLDQNSKEVHSFSKVTYFHYLTMMLKKGLLHIRVPSARLPISKGKVRLLDNFRN